jgi:protein TonB
MTLRIFTFLSSFVLHGAIVAFFLAVPGGAALDTGAGSDLFLLEHGIEIEGIAKIGDAETTIEAVEAPPEVSEARPPIEEVKPAEPEVQHVIGSDAGPEQQKVVEEREPDPIEQARPPQVAAIEQTEVAVEEQLAAGAKQIGGEATAVSMYRGRLYEHLSRKKVNPHSRQEGTVVVRFTVDTSGHVLSREVMESSGSKTLDAAAVASIDRAAPFPPMPSDVGGGPMVVSVPFKFSVR